MRERIRAAQEAELAGDLERAAGLLRQAAAEARAAGHGHRALKLMRHALRLLESGTDEALGLTAEISELEGAEADVGGAVGEGAGQRVGEHVEGDVELASSAWDAHDQPEPEPEPEPEPAFASNPTPLDPRFIRGPVHADPGAWCSFCCRPDTEVGALIAGPAGAFICGACVTQSRALLAERAGAQGPSSNEPLAPSSALSLPGARSQQAVDPPSVGDPLRERSRPEASSAAAPLTLLEGQRKVLLALERALEGGARCVLLLGAPGSGVSTVLTELVARSATLPADPRLLDRPSPDEARRALAASDDRPIVFGHRRRSPADRASIAFEYVGPGEGWGSSRSLLLPSTEGIFKALGGALPRKVVDHVERVVSLPALTRDELTELARRWLATRTGVAVDDAGLASLVEIAYRSGRGAHELRGLLGRLPPGTWTLGQGKPRR